MITSPHDLLMAAAVLLWSVAFVFVAPLLISSRQHHEGSAAEKKREDSI